MHPSPAESGEKYKNIVENGRNRSKIRADKQANHHAGTTCRTTAPHPQGKIVRLITLQPQLRRATLCIAQSGSVVVNHARPWILRQQFESAPDYIRLLLDILSP